MALLANHGGQGASEPVAHHLPIDERYLHFKSATLLPDTTALLTVITAAAYAHGGYSDRPIRLAAGISAGASSDTVGREIAKSLTERL